MSLSPPPRPRHAELTPIIGGVVLILVGTALMADQVGYAVPYRWLFLVLLVPAAAAIADAFRAAKLVGWRHVQPISRVIAGALFAAIGMLMFLKLDTGLIMPALIIVLGAVTILRTVLARR